MSERCRSRLANPNPAKSSHLQTGGKGMRAIVIEEFGGVEKLELENVDDPEVGAGEVLVRVRATSVNPVDWRIRSGASKGRFDVELPAILGRDLAGEVERAGEGVIGFAKGQRVMAMANGTYAELVTAKADVLAPIPDNLSFERAAALPLVVLTGAQLIERAVKAGRGQTVLILARGTGRCRKKRSVCGAPAWSEGDCRGAKDTDWR